MKKLLFAVALIGVLIGSVLGGIALADKPDAVKPLDTMAEIEQNTETIIEGVGNVTDRLDNTDWGLQEIKTEVAAIEGNITSPEFGLAEIKAEVFSIEGKVDTIDGIVDNIESDLASIPLMETATDCVNKTGTGLVWGSGSYYPDAAHFDLSVLVIGLGTGEEVWIKSYYPVVSGKISTSYMINSDGQYQFSRDCMELEITATVTGAITVCYGVTTTYVP